jgi:acetyltransferase
MTQSFRHGPIRSERSLTGSNHPDEREDRSHITMEHAKPSSLGDGVAAIRTSGALTLSARPIRPEDEPLLRRLFERISPDDLHFRFFSGMRHIDHARLAGMIDVDYERSITFLAFDETDRPVGTVMVAGDRRGRDAEIAVSVDSDLKGLGIGWSLLHHGIDWARKKGFRRVFSIEEIENVGTIGLEREAGFVQRRSAEDPTQTIMSLDLT